VIVFVDDNDGLYSHIDIYTVCDIHSKFIFVLCVDKCN